MKLKPCPFCGSEELRLVKDIRKYSNGELQEFNLYIECLVCGSEGPQRSHLKNPDVIKSWNIRKDIG